MNTDLCAECGKPEDNWDHLEERWTSGEFPDAHPFVRAEPEPAKPRPPVVAPRPDPLKEIRTMTKQERAAAPPVIRGDEQQTLKPRLCTICKKPRTNHRGHINHRFTHPEAGPPKPSRAKSMVAQATRPLDPPAQRVAAVDRRTKTAKKAASTRKALKTHGEDKVHNVITLAAEIGQLREQLEGKLAELKEMLA